MLNRRYVLSLSALILASANGFAGSVGPVSYECLDATQTTGPGAVFTGSCTAESPFAADLRAGNFSYFEFEDWESFNLNAFVDPIPTNTVGVSITSASGGVTVGGSADQDDGVIDGTANTGGQRRTAFGRDVVIAFDASELGGLLPTHVGLVATGAGNFNSDIRIEFFGPDDALLGTIDNSICPNPLPSGSSANCNNVTEDDLFYGWTNLAGISRVTIDDPNIAANLINFDHLQYAAIIPLPPAFALLGSALALLGWFRRR
jgi:hypothetical protein